MVLSNFSVRGRTGFDGVEEAVMAGRGAAGLVKSGKKSNCQRRLRLRLRCVSSKSNLITSVVTLIRLTPDKPVRRQCIGLAPVCACWNWREILQKAGAVHPDWRICTVQESMLV